MGRTQQPTPQRRARHWDFPTWTFISRNLTLRPTIESTSRQTRAGMRLGNNILPEMVFRCGRCVALLFARVTTLVSPRNLHGPESAHGVQLSQTTSGNPCQLAHDDCNCLKQPLPQDGHCIAPRSRVALANASLNRPISLAKMPNCVPWWFSCDHQRESPVKPPWSAAFQQS